MTTPASLLRLDDAIARIARMVTPVVDVETVPLRDAAGRVLARDLVAPLDLPARPTSAMDGYAFRHGTSPAAPMRIAGRALAGRPFDGPVDAGACVRIMTGAFLPDDCDTVVADEDAQVGDDGVRVASTPPAGRHVRPVGEQLRRGDRLVPRGRRLRGVDIGAAASVGAPTLDVMRRLRVCVFSTGDEIHDPGNPVDHATIHDSNRPALIALVAALGAHVLDGGVVRDDPVALERAIVQALDAGADVIVTSGGVAGGDADHTRHVLERLGRIDFWKLAIKPGRPMAAGRIGDGHAKQALLLALPGNPVAALVVFHALVRDALLGAMGAMPEARIAITAAIDTDWPKQAGRTEFVPAFAHRDDGTWRLRPTQPQGSAALRSISEANCLIVLAHERGPSHAGDLVEAWPFGGLD